MITKSGRPSHTANIHIGGVYASREPAVVRTILGSCIAVCLRDPIARVGGMNHFLLPHGGTHEAESARYGVHAMELLINACMKAGADRRNIEAKVFGGGHVLRIASTGGMDVARSNIRFINEFLDVENIPVLKRDVGGTSPREVYFYTDTGRVLLRRLTPSNIAVDELVKTEQSEALSQAAPKPVDDLADNITLF